MMKTRHKGKILGIGSCIGIIAPATACADFDYTPGIELLHQWGYKTKISKTLKTNEGYLAGSDNCEQVNSINFLLMMKLMLSYVLVVVMVVHVFLIY